MSLVVKNSIYYMGANYIAKIFAIIATILAMRTIPIGLFGIFSHIKMTPVFFAAFVWIGMDSVIFRIINYRTRFILIGGLTLTFLVMAVILSYAAAIVPSLYIGEVLYKKYSLQPILVFGVTFSGLLHIFLGLILATFEEAKWNSISQVVLSFIGFLATLILVVSKDINVCLSVMIMLGVIWILVLAFVYKSIIYISIQRFILDIQSKRLKACALLNIRREFLFFRHYLFSSILGTVAKRIMNLYFAAAGQDYFLGILAAFNQLVDILQSPAWAINNSFGINRLKSLLRNRKNELAARLASFYSEVGFLNYILISSLLLSSPIWISFFIFSLQKWNLPYILVVTVVASGILRYIFDVLVTILQYNHLYVEEKIGLQVSICTLGSVALIPVNFFAVTHFGIYGALVSSLFPGILIFIVGNVLIKDYREVRRELIIASSLAFLPISFVYVEGNLGYTFLACLIVSGSSFWIFSWYVNHKGKMNYFSKCLQEIQKLPSLYRS